MSTDTAAAPAAEPALSVDPASVDDSAPAAEPEVAAKPKINVDDLVRSELIASRKIKAERTELETKRREFEEQVKRYEPLKEFLEPLSKVDQKAALKGLSLLSEVKSLLDAGDDAGARKKQAEAISAMVSLDDKICLALADMVDEAGMSATLSPLEAAQRVREAEKKAEKEEAERKAAEAEEAERKKDEEAKANLESQVTGYLGGMGKALAGPLAADLPLCAAFAELIPVADLREEIERRARAGESLAFADLLSGWETKFRATMDKLNGKAAPPPDTEIDAEVEAAETAWRGQPAAPVESAPAAPSKPVVRAGGSLPPPPAPRAKFADEEVADELEKAERAWKAGQRRF
jgi:hypothetical protein